jgi:uncharacterized integral membrane protein
VKWEAHVKALRIIQIIILIALAGYLVWVNNYNREWIGLPYIIDLPVGVVLGAALLIGWLVGWLFGQAGGWSKNREISKLKKRVAELERQEPKVTAVNITRDAEPPVIPDRTGTVQRGTSEYENL